MIDLIPGQLLKATIDTAYHTTPPVFIPKDEIVMILEFVRHNPITHQTLYKVLYRDKIAMIVSEIFELCSLNSSQIQK